MPMHVSKQEYEAMIEKLNGILVRIDSRLKTLEDKQSKPKRKVANKAVTAQ